MVRLVSESVPMFAVVLSAVPDTYTIDEEPLTETRQKNLGLFVSDALPETEKSTSVPA